MDWITLTAGQVWRDYLGNIICVVADVHGGRVLLARPENADETPEYLIRLAKQLHPMRGGQRKTLDDLAAEGHT